MTTIVGVQGSGFALVASDAMTSMDDRPFMAKGMNKVTEKGDYLFAVSGDAIVGHIANHLWKFPKLSKTMALDDFVMCRVMPSFRTALILNGYDPKPDDKDAGWEMLLAINGTLYHIDDDFGWCRDDRGLYAIGSGGSLALGALAALETTPTSNAKFAEKCARRAIEISTSYSIYTGGETQLVVQRTKNG